MKRYKSELKEEVNVQKVINDLIDTSWSGSNENQGRAVSLLKGLAFSDDSKANLFMKKLDDFTSGLNKEDFKWNVIKV